MADEGSLSATTREQLYELVWSTPATKLAEKFGVSDVAIFKRCRKLAVPRPERGYWAKLAYGKTTKRPDLPPSPEEVFTQEAQKPIDSKIALLTDPAALNPIAATFLSAVESSALGYDKHRVHLREQELPETQISKSQAARAAAVFHALMELVEPRGIFFKRAVASYEGGFFKRGHDRLYFKIEEELVENPEPRKKRKIHDSDWRQDTKMPAGRLTFTLNPTRYGLQAEKRWSESDKAPLETIVTCMAKEIYRHFADLQKKKEAEAIQRKKDQIESEIRWKRYQEEEAIRQKEAAQRKHAEKLEKATRAREGALIKAAAWWRLYRDTEEFIRECENRWRTNQSGELPAEKQAWLQWARNVSACLNPFALGYPDPVHDGDFEPSAVPPGGPYPAQRDFPHPPTMRELPPSAVVQQGSGSTSNQNEPKPYPFWLKHQR